MKTTLEKLEKARNSLSNFVYRGGTCRAYASYGLIDRYDDLRAKAINENVWSNYCEKTGFAIDHTATDFFA
jgi:hypothetical protein